MTHVSKNKLTSETQEKLFLQLNTLFIIADKKQTPELFSELLTKTEKIMIIKRLAIVVMLTKQHSNYAISKALQVSDSTVRVMRRRRTKGEYETIEKVFRKRTFDSVQFWETVETLLQLGMPSRGKGRWKSVYKSINRMDG